MITAQVFWHTKRALDKSVSKRASGAFVFKLRHSLPTLILVAAGIAHVPSIFHVNASVKDAT